MRPTFLAFCLIATTAAFAQTQPSTQSSATSATAVLTRQVTLSDCPVGMSAQQVGSGQTRWAISLEDAQKTHNEATARTTGIGVHVDLKARKTSAIRQVELAVYYAAPGTHYLPVRETLADNADLKKSFVLAASGDAPLKLAGDLLVGAAAGITRVHLVGIDYADGHSWHAKHDNVCSVAPNHLMLVGSR